MKNFNIVLGGLQLTSLVDLIFLFPFIFITSKHKRMSKYVHKMSHMDFLLSWLDCRNLKGESCNPHCRDYQSPGKKTEHYLHSLFVLSQELRRKLTKHFQESKVGRWIVLSFLILVLEGKLYAISTVQKYVQTFATKNQKKTHPKNQNSK